MDGPPASPQTLSHWPSWPGPIALPLHTSDPHPCSYLAGRAAMTRAFATQRMPAEMYQRFMDAGYRRSGTVFYQPACPGCRQCVPLRLRVDRFAPTRSQRRCARRNQDLLVEVGSPDPTPDKHALYRRYLAARHDQLQADDWQGFLDFLYHSPTTTLEFCYRTPAGTLVAVGICDLTPLALSSVYFYFDPQERRRGLGTFGVLTEIRYARSAARPFYYLGYWVAGAQTMAYKADFGPHELLGTDGLWRAP